MTARIQDSNCKPYLRKRDPCNLQALASLCRKEKGRYPSTGMPLLTTGIGTRDTFFQREQTRMTNTVDDSAIRDTNGTAPTAVQIAKRLAEPFAPAELRWKS